MSFSGWRLIGIIFIIMSVSNLMYDDRPEGFEWLVYLDLLNLILWAVLITFEGKKK